MVSFDFFEQKCYFHTIPGSGTHSSKQPQYHVVKIIKEGKKQQGGTQLTELLV